MGAGGRRLLGVVGTRFRTVFLPACARHNSVVSGRSFIAALVGAVIDVLGSAIRRFRTAINAFCVQPVRALSAPADRRRTAAPEPCQRRKIRVCGQLAALWRCSSALSATLCAPQLNRLTRVLQRTKGRSQPSEGLARARETSQATNARARDKISTTDARAQPRGAAQRGRRGTTGSAPSLAAGKPSTTTVP